MPVDELRQRVKIMTAAEPDFVRPFLMRQMKDSERNENSKFECAMVFMWGMSKF